MASQSLYPKCYIASTFVFALPYPLQLTSNSSIIHTRASAESNDILTYAQVKAKQAEEFAHQRQLRYCTQANVCWLQSGASV